MLKYQAKYEKRGVDFKSRRIGYGITQKRNHGKCRTNAVTTNDDVDSPCPQRGHQFFYCRSNATDRQTDRQRSFRGLVTTTTGA